jgi:capsular polysaccharide transport system permease protein
MVKAREALTAVDKLFLLAVVIPTLAAVLYFGFFASDVYVSESQFVVRSPDKAAPSGLSEILLKGGGLSESDDEVYAAQDFVRSRDALKALNAGGAVARAYGNANVSVFDRFNPLGLTGSFEDLYRYYQGKLNIQYDTSSSITSLTVRAFNSNDAYQFNRELLGLAEDVVNRLNTRSRNDLVRFAGQEVEDAEVESRDAAIALAAFRNAHGVVDPEMQAKVQLEMISKLQDELIGARTQLLELRAMAPENPQIPILQVRIKGLTGEIDDQMGRVAGSQRSLSANAVQYEKLDLERQFADKRVAAALTSFQDAQTEARRKQAYVERIVNPNLPDAPTEPRRLRGVIATLMLGLLAWGILRLLIAGIREHHG